MALTVKTSPEFGVVRFRLTLATERVREIASVLAVFESKLLLLPHIGRLSPVPLPEVTSAASFWKSASELPYATFGVRSPMFASTYTVHTPIPVARERSVVSVPVPKAMYPLYFSVLVALSN